MRRSKFMFANDRRVVKMRRSSQSAVQEARGCAGHKRGEFQRGGHIPPRCLQHPVISLRRRQLLPFVGLLWSKTCSRQVLPAAVSVMFLDLLLRVGGHAGAADRGVRAYLSACNWLASQGLPSCRSYVQLP
jgi:hypothetical protein